VLGELDFEQQGVDFFLLVEYRKSSAMIVAFRFVLGGGAMRHK